MLPWLRRLFSGSPHRDATSGDRRSEGAYPGLRQQALEVSRADAGIPDLPPDAVAWGVVMETGYPEATVTLLSLADGTTSLYFSTGGGIIGGHGHAAVRRASVAFVEAANRSLDHLAPTREFPLPGTGQTLFYIRTDAGVLTGAAPEEELGGHGHPLSFLYYGGQAVITELRLIDESEERES